MKIVTGLFHLDQVITVIRHLRDNGFTYEELSLISSVSEMPAYLEGDPEESATVGAGAGAAVGGTLGAASGVIVSNIPGLEGMLMSGFLTTALGGVIGGYLGSLYSVRAESKTTINIHEALEAGQILLVVQTTDENKDTAVAIMEECNGMEIESHTIATEAFVNS